MGFFSILETFFFISLAITFVLIMMLVYHFKGRLVTLEQKCDTMFEIMNNMVKEMKNIRGEMNRSARPPQMSGIPSGMPPELMHLFQMGPGMSSQIPVEYLDAEEDDDDEEEEDEDDEEEETEFKKIVVSDTEVDSDDGEEDDVKVINIEIGDNTNEENVALPDLEEMDDSVIEDEPEDIVVNKLETTPEYEPEESLDKSEPMDYKKLDVSYLRTLVITRGLATDTKKMKKPELVKLLEEQSEDI